MNAANFPRLCSTTVILAISVSIAFAKASTSRSLLQSRVEEQIEITEDNIGDFVELVGSAERNTVFVFTVDIQLTSQIVITTNRLSFLGKAEQRPIIRCAENEGGFQVNSDRVLFENIIIKDCQQTAVTVFDEVEEYNPFFDGSVQDEVERLNITFRNVDFIDNAPKQGEATSGAISIEEEANAHIVGCRFERNEGDSGGAIRFAGRTLSLENSTFVENVAERTGGAIFALHSDPSNNEDTIVSIVDCHFLRNRVRRGGEDRTSSVSSDSSLIEDGRQITFNAPSPSGGALYISDFHTLTVANSIFAENTAVPAGGALYLNAISSTSFTGCRFHRNSVLMSEDQDVMKLQQGGAIYATFSTTDPGIEFSQCTFTENRATFGGALHFLGPDETALTIGSCRFSDNLAAVGGGAVVLRHMHQPALRTTVFTNNSAVLGGAMFITNGGGLDVIEPEPEIETIPTFQGNVAFDGGAIFANGAGSLAFGKCIFRRNKAERNGGALCIINSDSGGGLGIRDARMSDNTAAAGGAIYAENTPSIFMNPGTRDRNADFVGEGGELRTNEFVRNAAVVGGAVFYRASNLVENTLLIDRGLFIENQAGAKVPRLEELDETLPWILRDSEELVQLRHRSTQEEQERRLLDLRSSEPCFPGGGGAICAVLSALSARASVSVELIRTNFTENSAQAGGALVLVTEEKAVWSRRCPNREEQMVNVLVGNACRQLNLRALNFKRNRAQHAGGAILASNFNHVFYSGVDNERAANFIFQTLDEAAEEQHFVENSVGKHGYGPNVAGAASRLSISSPSPDPTTGVLVSNHSSGQATPLPAIQIQVLDALDQIISGGTVDSVLSIRANSLHPERKTSIVSGQVVSAAMAGIAVFDALSLTAEPGRYEVDFSASEIDVHDVSANMTLRECFLGERYNERGSVCETCQLDTFTFYDNVPHCLECSDHAKCPGNASLIPESGYWHSSPFSVLMHKCFQHDACSYDQRSSRLFMERDRDIDNFFQRFDEVDEPVFTNDEYMQCAVGYQGPLCGACEPGYGRGNDKSCRECSSRAATSLFILLLAIWQLALLSVTIRSALVSIRDMNQMVAFSRQQTSIMAAQSKRLARLMSMAPTASSRRVTAGRQPSRADSELRYAPLATPVESVETRNTSTSATLSQQRSSSKPQHAAEYIIAAQHVSETIKIAVNFLQITSIAANIDMDWTYSLRKAFAAMSAIAGFSTGGAFAPLSCLLDSDLGMKSTHIVVLRLAIPISLTLMIAAVFLVRWVWLKSRPSVSHFVRKEYIKSRIAICFLVTSFFLYQSFAEDFMGILSCIRLDSKEISGAERYDDADRDIDFSKFSIARGTYWTEDTSVQCFKGSHAYLVGLVGIPGTVCFLAGLPVYLLVFLLHKRRRNQLKDIDVLNTHGFIYQNYEESFVYWEVCILFRKALLAIVVVFAYPLGPNLQGIMAQGVLSLALAIHLIACPFKYLTLNVLEASSLLVSIFTLYSGLIFTDENTSRSVRILLSLLLILINSSLAIVFVLAVLFYGDRFVISKLKFLEVAQIPKNPASRICSLTYLLFRGTTFNMTEAAMSIRYWFGPRKDGDNRSVSNNSRITQSGESDEPNGLAAANLPPSHSNVGDNNEEITVTV